MLYFTIFIQPLYHTEGNVIWNRALRILNDYSSVHVNQIIAQRLVSTDPSSHHHPCSAWKTSRIQPVLVFNKYKLTVIPKKNLSARVFERLSVLHSTTL